MIGRRRYIATIMPLLYQSQFCPLLEIPFPRGHGIIPVASILLWFSTSARRTTLAYLYSFFISAHLPSFVFGPFPYRFGRWKFHPRRFFVFWCISAACDTGGSEAGSCDFPFQRNFRHPGMSRLRRDVLDFVDPDTGGAAGFQHNLQPLPAQLARKRDGRSSGL